MSSFEAEWRRRYGDHRPLGYALRSGSVHHWVRFHSLPESKRYADTDDERRIILDRQNRLAVEVLGQASCWIVQTIWDGAEVSAEGLLPAPRELKLPVAWRFEAGDDEYCGDGPWVVRAAEESWEVGRFDSLLQEIADDEAVNTLWMSAVNGAVFAPYDGGVDLFLSTEGEVERLRKTYADWLSRHPEGL